MSRGSGRLSLSPLLSRQPQTSMLSYLHAALYYIDPHCVSISDGFSLSPARPIISAEVHREEGRGNTEDMESKCHSNHNLRGKERTRDVGDGSLHSPSLLSQVSHILPPSLKPATQFERMPGMRLISI
ncbi:unnamed protein product [Leuciscus chuanchicus]